MSYDTKKIDEAVLALLYLNAFQLKKGDRVWRAWKGFNWDSLDRWHEQGLISNPKSKAKSVALTEEGLQAAKELVAKQFALPRAAEQPETPQMAPGT